MSKTFITAALAAATLTAGAAPAQAASWALDPAVSRPGDAVLIKTAGCYPGEVACRDRMRWERSHHNHYVWRNGRYEDDSGAAVVGGILGFALGAAIAGSQTDHDYYWAHRGDRGWRSRCRASYPGFDWRSGTYIGRDGYRHYCVK